MAAGCSNEASSAPVGIATEAEGIDVDLTMLSSTIAYAKVNSIMEKPDEYLGQTIKIRGPFDAFYYERTGVYYSYVLIEDIAACCMQRMEFIVNGQHTYPDDFPEKETMIELVGVFGSYDELSNTYYYLAVDEIVIWDK